MHIAKFIETSPLFSLFLYTFPSSRRDSFSVIAWFPTFQNTFIVSHVHCKLQEKQFLSGALLHQHITSHLLKGTSVGCIMVARCMHT